MPAPPPITAHKRARLAALTRHRSTGDPAVMNAARDLAAEQLAQHVLRVVSTFPPLTAEQRDRIAALLRPTEGAIG